MKIMTTSALTIRERRRKVSLEKFCLINHLRILFQLDKFLVKRKIESSIYIYIYTVKKN
jgi:hypothetical protein